jgi:hypothetical protein
MGQLNSIVELTKYQRTLLIEQKNSLGFCRAHFEKVGRTVKF